MSAVVAPTPKELHPKDYLPDLNASNSVNSIGIEPWKLGAWENVKGTAHLY